MSHQDDLKSLPPPDLEQSTRTDSSRAKRLPGIAYDSVPASLKDSVIEPGDLTYPRVKSTFFRGGAPGIVFQTKDTGQVVEAVRFARSHPHLPLGIRSGGHGIRGRSTNDGGIVIDLSRMAKIEVLDPSTQLVRIEPGARWMDVAAALDPFGWALSSGDSGAVGVGGLATAGGIGLLGRAHGLTIDRLRAVELVLADGSVVRASDREYPDLFWAVQRRWLSILESSTSFDFQAAEVRNVGWAQMVFDAGDIAGFLEKWGGIVESSPRDLTSFLILNPPRPGQPAIAFVMTMINSDNAKIVEDRLKPIVSMAPMLDQRVEVTSYASILANAHVGQNTGVGEPVSRSGSVEHVTPEFAVATAALLRSGATYFFQIRSMGGAIADVPVEATAFGSRSANFEVTAAGTRRERLDESWDSMQKFFCGLYYSFDTDPRPERVRSAFPPSTLARLRALKLQYDPGNLFRDSLFLEPRRPEVPAPQGPAPLGP